MGPNLHWPMNRLLPNELWEAIFLYLDYPSVLRCLRVCRLFNDIISESGEIQYRGELTMDGMIDTGTSNLTVKERLAFLRERRAAWDNLQWKSLPKQCIPGSYHAYDFVGGIYGIIRDYTRFTAVTLPTKSSQGHQSDHALEFSARDFAMDPTQDVIVFLGQQTSNDPATYLHVRSLESLAPHPQSEQSRISVNCPKLPRESILQFSGDLFALAFITLSATVLDIRIWNWKTGQLLYNISLTHTVAKAESFTLLNSDAFAVISVNESGYIEIYNTKSTTPVSRLYFPELDTGELHSAVVDSPPLFGQPWPDRVFTSSPTHRVHTFTLSYLSADEEVVLRAYIMNDVLLPYATPSTSEHESTMEVRWEDWGPHNTRIMDADPFEHTHCFSEGSRVVLPMDESDSYIRVLDFNFHRKPAEDQNTSKSSVVSITSPTTISSLFKEDIQTDLPYTMHLRVMPNAVQDRIDDPILILDECRVVVLNEFNMGDQSEMFTMAI